MPTRKPQTETSEQRPVKKGEILAPEDWKNRNDLHAPDGRKLKDADHVGAATPDADADDELPHTD